MTYQQKIPKKFRIIPKSIRFLRVAPNLVGFNSHNYSTIIHPTKTLQGILVLELLSIPNGFAVLLRIGTASYRAPFAERRMFGGDSGINEIQCYSEF